MLDGALVDKLANLGGMAVCIFILVRVVVEIAKRWTDDLKASAQREREAAVAAAERESHRAASLGELHKITVAHMAAVTQQLGGVATQLASLQSAIMTRLDDTWTGGDRRNLAAPTPPR